MTRRTASAEFERLWQRIQGLDQVSLDDLRVAEAYRANLVLALALRETGQAQGYPDAEATWDGIVPRLQQRALGGATRPPVRPRPHRHWPVRVLAAAAALIAFVVAALRSEPGSVLYPVRTSLERTAVVLLTNDASIELRIADARLDDLVHTLSKGPFDVAPGVARALVAARAAAVGDGADVRTLDAEIQREVPPALLTVPSPVASKIRAILGRLLPPFDGSVSKTYNGSPGPRHASMPREPRGPHSSPPAGSVASSGTDRSSTGSDGGDQGSGGSDQGSGGGDQGSGGSDQGSGDQGSGGSDQGSGDQGSGGSDQGSGDQGSGGSDQGSGDQGSGGSGGTGNSN